MVTCLDGRISRAAELAVRARIHLDFFVFLTRKENLDEFQDTLAPHADFFRFSRVAHEWAFYIRINSLLTRRNDTDNFPDLLRELEKLPNIDPELAKKAQNILDHVNPFRKAIKHIRDKAVTHQDSLFSQPEVYAQAQQILETNSDAQLNLPALIEFSDAVLEIAQVLCTARGLSCQQLSSDYAGQLRTMLLSLRQARQDRKAAEGLEKFLSE